MKNLSKVCQIEQRMNQMDELKQQIRKHHTEYTNLKEQLSHTLDFRKMSEIKCKMCQLDIMIFDLTEKLIKNIREIVA